MLGIVGVQVAGRFLQREAVGGSQRQDQVIFIGGCLQFEIEATAEAFSQRQPPGPVYSGTKGGVDDEMHVTGFIEEALENDVVLTRYQAEDGLGCCQIVQQLF